MTTNVMHLMDRLHSVDIDEIDDFTMVKALVNYLPEFKEYFL